MITFISSYLCYNEVQPDLRSNNAGRIMSRKSKQSKHKKNFTIILSQVDQWLDLIGHHIFQGNYAEAVANCERLSGTAS